jgi:N-acetylglutamate synthase-like GNAT family acetyltransferase
MANADLVIRDARAGESVALSELMLRSKAHWGYDAALLERWRGELVVGEEMIARKEVFVAERDGEVLGVAAVTDAPPDVELDTCFVEPAAIGTGVGRVLVETAIARARDVGACTMRVVSDPNAEAFYARLGAVRVGEVPSDVPARVLPLLRFDLAR